MIKLYGAAASPFVRKAMAALALKQLEYEHIPSMPFAGDKELDIAGLLGKEGYFRSGTIPDRIFFIQTVGKAFDKLYSTAFLAGDA